MRSTYFTFQAFCLAACSVGVFGQFVNVTSMSAIAPGFNESQQGLDLEANLNLSTAVAFLAWDDDGIPASCRLEAKSNNLSATDFEVRDVQYADCQVAWTLCRHKNAKAKWWDVVDFFGRIPLGMRVHVSHIVVIPDGNFSFAAYTRGTVSTFQSGYLNLGVASHEFTHILDVVAMADVVNATGYKPGTPFSETSTWAYAIRNDSHTPTPYARTNVQEDFADSGRWAMSDMTLGGPGLDEYNVNYTRYIGHQIQTYEAFLQQVIFNHSTDGMCRSKILGSQAVLKSTGYAADNSTDDSMSESDLNVTDFRLGERSLASGSTNGGATVRPIEVPDNMDEYFWGHQHKGHTPKKWA